ncbi:hypothetical protein BDN71DRAFT_1390591, partial [Pleurotus eryngii]
WAIGSQLAYLNQLIHMYKEGLVSKKRKQALDGIVNGYFEQYHWHIPIHTEPDSTTPNPKIQNSEKLMAEEKILQGKVIDKMAKSIHNWLDYHATKVSPSIGLGKAIMENDPYAILLAHLTGTLLKAKWLLPGWQLWMSNEWDMLRHLFQEHIDKTNCPQGDIAKECAKWLLDRFDLKKPEEQEYWNNLACERHKQLKQAMEDLLSNDIELTPTERHSAFECAPSFLDSFLQPLLKLLGLNISIFLGRPQGNKGGQVNAVSLHYGKDKAAIPRTWPHSQKASYRKATDLFLEFMELCFSEFIPHDSLGLNAHVTVFSSGRTPCGCTSRYRC